MKWKKVLIAVAILDSVLLLGAIGFYFSTDIPSASSKYVAEREKAVKAGLTMSLKEYAESMRVDPKENAYEFVEPLLKKADKVKVGKPGEQWLAPGYETIKPYLPKLQEAKKKKHCVFPKEYKMAAGVSFPEFSRIKNIVKILSAKATEASGNNDLATARQCWADAGYLASICKEDKTLIGLLVRIACNAIIMDSMRLSLQDKQGSKEWVDMIDATVAGLEIDPDTRPFLSVEHMFACDVTEVLMRDPKSINSFYVMEDPENPTPKFSPMMIYVRMPGFKEASLARIHESYTAVLADLPQDSFDFIATRKAFQHLDDRAEMKGASYLILNFAAPVFSQVFVATHKQTAQAALLQEAVAQIRKRNFDQPELILKGNRYTDLDDKPLKIKKVRDGILVYSITPDQEDQGGVSRQQATKQGQGAKADFPVLVKK